MAIIAVVMGLVIALPTPVLAHPTQSSEQSRPQGIDREIARLQDELSDLGAEEHDLAHRLEDPRAVGSSWMRSSRC